MPTCAIYARVSDESQVKGDSIAHQIGVCREMARRKSLDSQQAWLVPDDLVYVDEGITGTSLVKRAMVQRLIGDARKGAFQVVLFKGISRFARDTVDALLMLRNLLASGVRVVSMEENFDSQRDNAEFVFTIHSALAQAESEKTAVRVRMGAAQKARTGRWNGRAPDGYWLNPATQRLELDVQFAPIIAEIFKLYRDGYGVRRIAQTLNSQGRRTKQGNWWSQRQIARLLKNPVYAGDVTYGRRTRRLCFPDQDDLLARKKVAMQNPDADTIVTCQDAHTAIISREHFQAVQQLLAARASRPGRIGRDHLLTKGLAKCACQSSFTIKYNGRGTAYYQCLGQKEYGRAFCDRTYIRADVLEGAVLAQVRSDCCAILPLAAVRVMDANAEGKQHTTAPLQLEGLYKESQQVFERYVKGGLSEEEFRKRSKDVRDQIAHRRLEAQAAVDRNEALCEKGSDDVHRKLQEALVHLLSPHTPSHELTRRLLETLVACVVVTDAGIELSYRFRSCF